MQPQVAVIGDGGWGTALALLLREKGARVRVWSAFPEYAQDVRANRENRLYLPGVPLPPDIHWTGDPSEAVEDAEVLVLAVPSRYWRAVLERFAGCIPKGVRLISVSKGLDPETGDRLTQVAERALGLGPVAALSGPSLAAEVARGAPTAVTVACVEEGVSREMQRLFNSGRFRVYTSTDVIGVELGGALKNVIAIAAGVSDGLGLGDNSRAALVTRGLAEMTRFGVALGARASTFYGLSGMGDLVVTCTSRRSRNHTVGERLGKGESLPEILAGMKQVAEGVENARTVRSVASRLQIDMPVSSEVFALLYEGKRPRDAVKSLMERDLKSE